MRTTKSTPTSSSIRKIISQYEYDEVSDDSDSDESDTTAEDSDHDEFKMQPLHPQPETGAPLVSRTIATSGSSTTEHPQSIPQHYFFHLQGSPDPSGCSDLFHDLRDLLLDGDVTDEPYPYNMHCSSRQRSYSIENLVNERHMHYGTNELSPLAWAAHNGQLDAVNELLECGADADAEATTTAEHTGGTQTVLAIAAINGHAEVVRTLIAHGAGPNRHTTDKKTGQRFSALLLAAAHGKQASAGIVSILADAGADLDFAGGKADSVTALMVAAENDFSAFCLELLRHGAEVDLATPQGFTPLMFASQRGSARACELLIEFGANVHAECESGGKRFPLFCGTLYGHADVVRILISAGASIIRHHSSSKNGLTSSSTSSLTEASNNPKQREEGDDGGALLLLLAIAYGHYEAAGVLVESGADVNAMEMRRRGDMRTALMTAAEEGQEEIVELLLSNSCDVNAQDGQGQTAYTYALPWLLHRPNVAKAIANAGGKQSSAALLSGSLSSSSSTSSSSASDEDGGSVISLDTGSSIAS